MFDKLEFIICLKRANLTVEDVANALDINVTTLYRKINGDSDFYRHEIEVICNLIGRENLEKVFFSQKLA